MYDHKHHRGDAAYLARFAPGGDMQADFATHVQHLRPALEQARVDGKRLALLVVLEAGHPVPDVRSRAMLGEFQAEAIFTPHLVVVSGNPLLRGVLTALEWIRGKEVAMQSAPDVSRAIEILERARGASIQSLRLAVTRIKDTSPSS